EALDGPGEERQGERRPRPERRNAREPARTRPPALDRGRDAPGHVSDAVEVRSRQELEHRLEDVLSPALPGEPVVDDGALHALTPSPAQRGRVGEGAPPGMPSTL